MASSTTKKVGVVAAATAAAVTYLWQSTPPVYEPQPTLGEGCQPPDVICELPCAVRGETESRLCLACHDGAVATPIAGHYNFGEELGNHPYDVDLYTARLETGIKPLIDRRLVLVHGNLVGCTTCHNYWAVPQEPKWIAMPAHELCQGCHDK